MSSSLVDAARSKNINEVQKLLQQNGVDVNAREGRGNTALHLAKDTSIAKLLINAGADPNLKNADGYTPLHMWHVLDQVTWAEFWSDHRKYLELVTLLLEAGASPNIQNNHGYNCLHSLFVNGGMAGLGFEASLIHDFISLLFRFDVDVNMPDFERCTPLHHAVNEPHARSADMLIRSGAQIDARDFHGMTPLQYVFHSDNKEMIQLLLQNKADVNTQDLDGRTTLSTAAEVGNEVMVQLLLEDPRTCINLADKNGVTPLHLAAAFKHVDITEMLIRASANLNVRDLLNATPLHYAAYGGTPEVITLLLEAGADDKLIDNAGWLPIQYALSRHYYHTALRFGEEYLVDVAANAKRDVRVTGATVDDVIAQSLPADDIFAMFVPASNVYSKEFDSSIVPHDLVDFLKEKSAGNISGYLRDMYTVAGVGTVPTNMPEVEKMKRSIEEFMSKWAVEIAKIDERFKGNLLRSGSVYEGTKIGDPDEFDYMLCLEELAQICLVTFDEDTKYNEVTIHKNMNETGVYEDFFDGEQLDSETFMRLFVDVAKRALTRLADHTPVAREIYVEDLTEDTLVQGTWTLTGTVTCNLKFKWAGLYYKQLVISVDLVPAIPVRYWPPIAREVSGLLTDDIKSRGCHLVPKSGYWRLSFSLAESLIMASISREQKSAFIGAKVVLHPVVSCKIVVYDDDRVSVDEDGEEDECGLEEDGIAGSVTDGARHFEQNECAQSDLDAKDVSVDESVNTTESGSLGEARKSSSISVPFTIAGRVALSQQGDRATVLKLSDSQDCKSLHQWSQINSDDAAINSPEKWHLQKLGEQEEFEAENSSTGNDSDVPIKTLLPFDVLSTYLLKNLFFNCIEENAKETNARAVTTGQIFSKLIEFLKESRPIPYFFIPNQYFSGLDALLDNDRRDFVLVATVINTLLNEG